MSDLSAAKATPNIFSLMRNHRSAVGSDERASALVEIVTMALEGVGVSADAACRYLRDNLKVVICRASSPRNDNGA